MKKAPTLITICLIAILTLSLASCGRTAPEEPPQADVTITAQNEFMQAAIEEALAGTGQGHGGPFGCVVVKDGEIVGRGHNTVLLDNDATAHGEINAIRDAGEHLGTYDLSGCELYTTGEPCMMCLCACLWANVDKVYFGCTITDSDRIGFRDEDFDELLGGREAFADYLICIDRDACLELYDYYLTLDAERY